MRAFDPATGSWVDPGGSDAVPVPPLRGVLVCDRQDEAVQTDEAVRDDEARIRWAAEDFGHLVHRRPRAVLRPHDVADVAAIMTFAGRAGLPVAARGAGHSTYGQGQAPGGIVIDMAGLGKVGEVRDGRITVQAGALWSEVLDAALADGWTPPVLTDYLHTTVGGTLAVGGVGGTSQHHGMQVDVVEELDVVTGAGRLVTCSPHRHWRLFDAVRAGLGQCGVITSATLRLVPAPARVRCYRLSYSDLGRFLADQRRLIGQGRFDYLEGQVLPGEPGSWRYLLEAAVYYTPSSAPDPAELPQGQGQGPVDGRGLLAGLSAERDEEDLSYRDFQHRMAPGEAALRATGEWFHPHPWLTVLLPEDTAATVVDSVLAELTAADLGYTGLGLLYPLRAARLQAPLTRVPDSELVWLFALLRTADTDEMTAGVAMVDSNRTIYEHAVAHGAVGYPINSLPMSADDWRIHFGERWPQLLAAKDEFDPHAILTPGQGITPVDRGG